MAKVAGFVSGPVRIKKTTSIGRSARSRPKSKHQKRMTKKYRGQG